MLLGEWEGRVMERYGMQRERKKDGADGRYADDEAMNRELKEVERWDDPALQFAASVSARCGSERSERDVLS
jgi:pre-mRNA-splicing factor CWC26